MISPDNLLSLSLCKAPRYTLPKELSATYIRNKDLGEGWGSNPYWSDAGSFQVQ